MNRRSLVVDPMEQGEFRRCTECGHEATEHARFCEQCGAALPSAGSAEAPRTPEALAEKLLTGRRSRAPNSDRLPGARCLRRSSWRGC
jgi:predicted amidophosphoribosyltransferase